jgi:O-antigen/teichoic acid export membrane protein
MRFEYTTAMQHKQLLQDETLAKKLITKGFWSYFFALIVAPIGYLLRMFLSNTVSVAEVGIFYSVLGLMGLIATYNDLGLTEAMQYFIPKFRIKNEKAKVRLVIVASFLMQMVTGILIFCLLYFGAEWLAIHHFHDMVAKQILQILAFYFFGMNIITLCSTMFVSFQDTFSQGIVQSVQQVVNLVFTVVFWAMASLTIVSYAWVWIIGTLTAILVGVGIVIGKYRHVFIREAGESSLFSLENSAHP